MGKQFVVIPPFSLRSGSVGDLIRGYEQKGQRVVSFQLFKQGNLPETNAFCFNQEISLNESGPLLVLGISDDSN